MSKEDIMRLLQSEGIRQNIPGALLMAIAATESQMNPAAMRYEPHWAYLVVPAAHAARLKITITTEEQLQKFSYGVMQVMGSVFREYGYQDMLPLTLEPVVNIRYGAMHLKKFLDNHKAVDKAVSAYNCGTPKKTHAGQWTNQAYVDKVMTLYKNFGATS